MQNNYCYAVSAEPMENMRKYRDMLAQAREPMQVSAGLPPRQRREHRAPLGMHLRDLINLTMAASTVLATGVAVMAL